MTPLSSDPRALRRLIAVTVVAASIVSLGTVAHSVWTGGTRPALAAVLFVVGIVAELSRSRRRVGVTGWNWSASDAAVTFALASAPGDPALLGLALGITVAHVGRIAPLKVSFNLAQNTIALVLATTLTSALVALGTPVAVAAGVGYLAFLLTNTTLVAAAVAADAGVEYREVVRQHAGRVLVSGASAAVLGLVAAWIRDTPAIAALVLLPLFSEHVAVRSHVAVAHRRLAVQATTVALQHRDRVEDAIGAALSAVSSHFASEEALLVRHAGDVTQTWRGPDGTADYVVGSPDVPAGAISARHGDLELWLAPPTDGTRLDRNDRALLAELAEVVAVGVDTARAREHAGLALRELQSIANERLDLRAELGSISRGLTAVERFVRRHWRGPVEDARRVSGDLRAMREQADLAVLDGPRDDAAPSRDEPAETWRTLTA